VPHNVLNAKPEYAAREADIVAQAGRRGQVTIATNMAGRGTDILLGGNPEFLAKQYLKEKEINPDDATPEQWAEMIVRAKRVTDAEHQEVIMAGGLHILGTERHESRRIDNQLRGRSGRQGDPGSSRFFLSLEDDLMRIFGGDRIKGLMLKLGMEEGVPIENRMVSKRIEAAQKSVEGHNFSIRKHLLEYDDVMNKQRENIYGLRRQLLEGFEGDTPEERIATQREFVLGLAEDSFMDLIEQYMSKHVRPDQWDMPAMKEQLRKLFAFDPDLEGIALAELSPEEAGDLWPKIEERYKEKEVLIGAEGMRNLERYIMLNFVDAQWKDHLLALDHLKEGISLRGYGQKDPLVEYKKESFYMFEAMLDRIYTDTIRYLFNLQVQPAAAPVEQQLLERRRRQRRGRLAFTKANETAFAGGEEEQAKPIRNQGPKIGRNDPCHCGSGKKYKKCHGA
ncbi:MAG: SEC-C metal-binding domain-containing protein, partial [Blastocatellia bacterium]